MSEVTLQSPQPIVASGRSLSPTLVYIDHSKSELSVVPPADTTVSRTSSPTPSEREELKALDGTLRRMFRKESWKDRDFVVSFTVIGFFITAIVVLIIFKDDVIDGLTPAAEWVEQAPAGFLIPVTLMAILSIPPLLGGEIIHIMCGLMYGLWMGFLAVCVGMIIGEIITFYSFRLCLRSRAERPEQGKGSLRWAALGRAIRDSGFKVALVVRYSAVPTHVGTALFAVCGVDFTVFILTLLIALPRQLAGVYIGVLAYQSTQDGVTPNKTVSTIVIVVTVLVTIIAMAWISRLMKRTALTLIRERRAHQQIEMSVEIGSFRFPSTPHDRSAVNLSSSSWSHRTAADTRPGSPAVPMPPPPIQPRLA